MEKKKVINLIFWISITILSAIGSYYFVILNSNFENDIEWYIHLFYGDKKVYFFNIIPMLAWEFVMILKFLLLWMLITSTLLYIKKFLMMLYK